MQLLSLIPTDPKALQRMGEMFDSDNDRMQAYHYYSEVCCVVCVITLPPALTPSSPPPGPSPSATILPASTSSLGWVPTSWTPSSVTKPFTTLTVQHTYSEHLTAPHLTTPHHTSPHRTSPHHISPHHTILVLSDTEQHSHLVLVRALSATKLLALYPIKEILTNSPKLASSSTVLLSTVYSARQARRDQLADDGGQLPSQDR